jgi:hypothetical protein
MANPKSELQNKTNADVFYHLRGVKILHQEQAARKKKRRR